MNDFNFVALNMIAIGIVLILYGILFLFTADFQPWGNLVGGGAIIFTGSWISYITIKEVIV